MIANVVRLPDRVNLSNATQDVLDERNLITSILCNSLILEKLQNIKNIYIRGDNQMISTQNFHL